MMQLKNLASKIMKPYGMGDLINKNCKLQNTNYKNIAHELHELTRISKKETNITTTKGGHGLHRSF